MLTIQKCSIQQEVSFTFTSCQGKVLSCWICFPSNRANSCTGQMSLMLHCLANHRKVCNGKANRTGKLRPNVFHKNIYKLSVYLLHCISYVKSNGNTSFELYLWKILIQSFRKVKSYLCLAKCQEQSTYLSED